MEVVIFPLFSDCISETKKKFNFTYYIFLCLVLSLLLSPTVSSCWRLGGMMSSQAGGSVTGQGSSSRASSLASSFHCCPSST